MPDTARETTLKRPRARDSRQPKLALGLLPDLVGYSLRKAQIAVFQNFQSAVAPHDITPGQFGVLILIRENIGSASRNWAPPSASTAPLWWR